MDSFHGKFNIRVGVHKRFLHYQWVTIYAFLGLTASGRGEKGDLKGNQFDFQSGLGRHCMPLVYIICYRIKRLNVFRSRESDHIDG